MKPKLLLFAIILPLFTFAQSSSSGIQYRYDASGNRIKRELAPDIVGRKANTEQNNSTSNTNTKGEDGYKENKNQEIASANHIQATFSPNPTATGNFAVLVQKSEKENSINPGTQPQKVNDNIAYVSVFNALGERIQYETTHYDKPLNIDLSAFSKGVYLVKVQVLSSVEGQNGEDVILHRMAYQ